MAHEIRFEDVEFEYREGLPVVRDFNVTVAGGSVVALVGRSGAGKTTVTDLVARFHDPTQGRIFLNGVDIRDLRLQSYRGLLALLGGSASLVRRNRNKPVRHSWRNRPAHMRGVRCSPD